ncbi:uncharacterized protein LY79DRAFT_413835 [Colletotrichum navitas]|uniref:Uncharacterized protein n=1 Tax=Colletotrichum navitas TaxID=681940 RepID=A0AAD8PNI6_9PEZI|nr:uncharacterized protein LY79DRAFT_413835 [Colletotrichum navitas]KAK1573397.1 hypothetical protein LY79DRAFT_413835 [Colletotrichum navitas]
MAPIACIVPCLSSGISNVPTIQIPTPAHVVLAMGPSTRKRLASYWSNPASHYRNYTRMTGKNARTHANKRSLMERMDQGRTLWRRGASCAQAVGTPRRPPRGRMRTQSTPACPVIHRPFIARLELELHPLSHSAHWNQLRLPRTHWRGLAFFRRSFPPGTELWGTPSKSLGVDMRRECG